MVLLLAMSYGPFAICCGILIAGIIGTFINAYPNKALLDYPYLLQVRDIAPSCVLAIMMGAAIYPIAWIGLGNLPTMVLQIVAGFLFYFAFSYLFHLSAFAYVVETIQSVRRKS